MKDKMSDSTDVGKRLKEARETMGISQNSLTLKTGIASSAISQYETGSRTPTLESIKKLAKALYVTVDWLLGMDTDPDAPDQEEQKQPAYRNNPIMKDVLDDSKFWESKGIIAPSQTEKEYIINNYDFRLTFRSMAELKDAYKDTLVFILQRVRDKGKLKK